MRILLLGSNGQLGHSFVTDGGLARRGELIVATRTNSACEQKCAATVDLSRPENLPAILDALSPDLIVNAAAYTAVDRAEHDEALATRVNGESVGVLGQWAYQNGASVLHYSTDYVFDGGAHYPYKEEAACHPIGAYGRSKLLGEQLLLLSGARCCILRTAWVYSSHGHNFLRSILRLASEKDELRIVGDQHGSPTSTNTLVTASLATIDRWMNALRVENASSPHIYHVTAGGHTTWYGFACAIIDAAVSSGMIVSRPQITSISTDQFPTSAKRPSYSVLDGAKFRHTFGISLPSWQEDLKQVLSDTSKVPQQPC